MINDSTIKYWFEKELDLDDVTELPAPHDRPLSNIKIPFVWAFYYLKNDFGFEDAIRDIISRGGETSINAAIVGALLGAALGLE